MKVVSLDDTVVKDSLVFREEESFWVQVVDTKLNPKNDTINNIKGLKDGLKDLKYTGILILVMVNAIWLALMILLATVRVDRVLCFFFPPLPLASFHLCLF